MSEYKRGTVSAAIVRIGPLRRKQCSGRMSSFKTKMIEKFPEFSTLLTDEDRLAWFAGFQGLVTFAMTSPPTSGDRPASPQDGRQRETNALRPSPLEGETE